jgi:hypothetical protein
MTYCKSSKKMNELEKFRDAFAGIAPWAGETPAAHAVDFLGTLTDITFPAVFTGDPMSIGGKYVETALPSLDDTHPDDNADIWQWRGEGWFEAVNWFEAAREAHGEFVMLTLGAWYGSQAVGCYRALQLVKPMPCRLVAVEPMADNVALIERHFRTNGIDPDAHWIVPMAVNDSVDPVLFPVAPHAMGPQNCFSTNERASRESFCREIIATGKAEAALSSLLLHNSTGITIPGKSAKGDPLQAEVKYVGATTLNLLLGPFARVDYLEADIQQSETRAFPPFVDLLKRKVRRIHIGTHGRDAHWMLHDLFAGNGWDIVFSYEPDATHQTALGTFTTTDGILTVHNPNL